MQRDLVRLSRNVYDVLVVGGGIYGVCVAWDAALRGLSVALVEKGDFGHATSANTLRIIHGGLRYLQHGNIYRVRQSIHERTVFMRIAPHLVHPLPFLVPTYGHLMRGKEILSLALAINDLVGFDRNRLEDPEKHIPRGRVISREECLRLFPGVDEKNLTGAFIFYDCQINSPERLVMAILQSAAKTGADLVNYVEATGFLREGNRVIGVKAKDVLSGEELDIRAKVVVNTTGPWLSQVLGLLHGRRVNSGLALSKAFNLLVSRRLLREFAVGVYSERPFLDRDALMTKGYRLFFITPWCDRSLIGTAHLPYDADLDHPEVTEEEIEDFLDEINGAYPGASLKRRDVCFAYKGLVPMVENEGGDVQLVKRPRILDHRKEEGIDGLISVTGVKFTEARYVAEKTVNLVFKKLSKTPSKSATSFTPVHGGQIDRFNDFVSRQMQARPQGLSGTTVRHLVCRYGSVYPEVMKYLDGNCGSGPFITEESEVLKAEILYGIREEMAQKLTDVVFRRTALGIAGYPDEAALRTCAAVASNELDWDQGRTEKELQEVKAVFSWTGAYA